MPTRFDDETLVAYLDGELPSEQVTAVEQGLHEDVGLRERLKSLRATWDLLSELPEETPNPQLAQSTIEMVTVALNKEASWSEWMAGNRWLVLGILSLLMMVTGALLGRVVTRRITTQLLTDLPVIVEYRSLESIENVPWLEELAAIEHLLAIGEGGGPDLIGDGKVPLGNQERAQWVDGLGETDRGRLEDNLQDFLAESQARKQEMRRISERILEDPQRTSTYLRTIRAYWEIRDTTRRKELAYFDNLETVQEKVDWVKQRVASAMLTNYAANMLDDDRQAIFDWFYQLPWLDLEPVMLMQDLSRDIEDSFITQQDIDNLRSQLSGQANKLLDALPHEEDRRVYIGFWVDAVLRPESNVATVTDAQLRQKFEELSGEAKDELEMMPEEEARAELLRMLGVTDLPADSE